jgi:CHAT domain-containing protein
VHRLGAAAAVALACWVAGAAEGAHAATADTLCAAAGAKLDRYPSDGDLKRATAQAQSRLARGAADAKGPADVELDVAASGAAQPSAPALTDYCLAAGELMRLSPEGSQLQARRFLLTAFRTANANGLAEPASLAAYRLGLLTATSATPTGARGARGSRGGVARRGTAAQAREAITVGERPCELLAGGGLDFDAGVGLSVASLACSAEEARRAADARTAALADLRLARLRLAVAEANPEVASAFRAQAWTTAKAGLGAAAGLVDPALRSELSGRLALTALDARSGADPDIADAAARLRASPDPGAQALGAAIQARLAFAAGDAAAARGLMEAAMLKEAQRDLPARMPEWRLMLAEMDPAHREAHVQAAYDALEAVRPLLPRFDPVTEESAFGLYMRQVFQSAVDVQLAGAEGPQAGARVATAQRILEAYRQAELQSAFGSECLPPRDALKPETLAEGEVMLYPVLLPDRLELLYVAGGAGGEARFRRLQPNRDIDRQAVSQLVETMVISLSGDEDESWRAASRKLYDLLIRPIEGELKPGGTLAIVPDGALRALPFAALIDRDGRYLVQKTRISVAPALAYSQPGAGEARGREQLVAAALEMEVNLPAGDFEKLNGTAEEAKTAAIVDGKRIARAEVLENFHKADLVGALTRQQVDVLHLATHASFNGRSDRAFIVANGEVILLSELRQILAANRTRGDELDLLVLSACETAVGDDEASMGLAGAAVQAGARSAIASLWPVNDIGTAQLMKDFYQLYRDGRSKSAALQGAQVKMIERGGGYADPNIWAAFTLLGAWR